jgi:isopentenyldiphosphate isomerase
MSKAMEDQLMTEVEMFDIFNEEMVHIGTDSRANVHAQGLWHQTFHCWLLNRTEPGGDRLLFQLRHKDKDTHPNKLDISCAGHLQAGETVEDGIRELKEELGITLAFDDLIACGMVANDDIISDQCIDREFNHIFLHVCNMPLTDYDFQTSEISGLFYINLIEFQSLFRKELDHIHIEGVELDEGSNKARTVKRTVNIHDFTPISEEYAQVLFDTIRSLQDRG